MQFAIIENVQREDLNALEEAKAYGQLNAEFSLTHAQISEIVGKERATISNYIRLLKLKPPVQQMILDNRISSGHARAILQVEEQYQERFAQEITRLKLSVRKAEERAKKINAEGWEKPQKRPHPSKILQNEAKLLKQKLGADVTISGDKNSGKIVLKYSSTAELKNILRSMGVKA